MALSTCPKCSHTVFERAELTPIGSNFKYQAIQCAGCGAVVGVTDLFNNAVMLEQLQLAVKKMADRLDVRVDL